jgi:hypothetical protein
MMIGSDLPIFKNGTSFQSLRLKYKIKYNIIITNILIFIRNLNNTCNSFLFKQKLYILLLNLGIYLNILSQ